MLPDSDRDQLVNSLLCCQVIVIQVAVTTDSFLFGTDMHGQKIQRQLVSLAVLYNFKLWCTL